MMTETLLQDSTNAVPHFNHPRLDPNLSHSNSFHSVKHESKEILEDWHKKLRKLQDLESQILLPVEERYSSVEMVDLAVFHEFPSSMAASPEAAKLELSFLKCLEGCHSFELQSQLVINTGLGVREAEERSTFDPGSQAKLAAELNAAFKAELLEDGMVHSAEQIIEEALLSTEELYIFEYLQAFCLDEAHPNFAASVLRCLGRRAHLGTKSWRINLICSALKIDDAEIRDAAVQAAESWGGQDMRNLLEAHAHHEPLQWLRKYVWDVVEDLGD